MAEEIELKFNLPPERHGDLARHPALRFWLVGEPESRHLVSTYFDTPALDLARAGMGLRIRTKKGRKVQTLKAAKDQGGGLHRRFEFESPVTGDGLDLAALAKTPFGDDIARVADALEPVFVTDFTRNAMALRFDDGTRAELVVDHGEVRAGAAKTPLSEIEIELETGSVATLLRAALVLAEDLPLGVEPASKADRGYDLVRPGWRPPLQAQIEAGEGSDWMSRARHAWGRWQTLDAAARLGLAGADPSTLAASLRELIAALGDCPTAERRTSCEAAIRDLREIEGALATWSAVETRPTGATSDSAQARDPGRKRWLARVGSAQYARTWLRLSLFFHEKS